MPTYIVCTTEQENGDDPALKAHLEERDRQRKQSRSLLVRRAKKTPLHNALLNSFSSWNYGVTDGESRRFAYKTTTVVGRYTVFNVDQVESATLDKYRADKDPIGNPEFADFAPAEELLKASGFDFRLGAERAAYFRPEPFDLFPNHTSGDYIVMPDKDRFLTEADFYCTAFHESAHAAEVRLGWDYQQKGYEMGELVAELTSAFMANELNLTSSKDNFKQRTHDAQKQTTTDRRRSRSRE